MGLPVDVPFPATYEVARTTVHLPEPIPRTVKDLSLKIERFYEGLDFTTLPMGCFEEEVLLSS